MVYAASNHNMLYIQRPAELLGFPEQVLAHTNDMSLVPGRMDLFRLPIELLPPQAIELVKLLYKTHVG